MSLANTPLFQRLLAKTPFSERELIDLISTAPRRYKDHYIKKKSGRGRRLISQPTKEIKFLQRVLLKNELSQLPIHAAATAYRKGISIKDHAQKHASSRYLLKLDFRDFFLSLHSTALDFRLTIDTDFSKAERWLICNILCRCPRKTSILRLSIGAPSSPLISNYLMYEFDVKLTAYCKEKEIIYTRYADDLALSSSRPHVLDETKEEVIRLLAELSYLKISLNEEKSVNVSKKRRRTLVGLTLSNQGLASVGREEKRMLRAAFHAYSQGKLAPEEVGRLRGKLSYILGVDPSFVLNLCSKYGITRVADIGIG